MPPGSGKKKASGEKGKAPEAESPKIRKKKVAKIEESASEEQSRSNSPEVPSREGSVSRFRSNSEDEKPRNRKDFGKWTGKKPGPSRQQSCDVSEKLQEYLESHRDLSVKPPRKHKDIKICPEEEVFVLQCHKSLLDPEKILGQKIYLSGRTKIKEEGLELSVDKFPEDTTKTVTVVSCPENKLKADTFPLAGKITLTRTIEKQEISYQNIFQDNAHEEFPSDLKVRHPLLGVNFEEKLAEIESIVIKTESPEPELPPAAASPAKSKRKRNRESSSPRKSLPAKKVKKETISDDLQWIQNVLDDVCS